MHQKSICLSFRHCIKFSKDFTNFQSEKRSHKELNETCNNFQIKKLLEPYIVHQQQIMKGQIPSFIEIKSQR
jgi:hypothetical protein